MRLNTRKLLGEPLVHFSILGVALFGLYALIQRDHSSDARGEEIVVTSGTIENLATTFGKVWQRPPTAEELKGLIDDHVKEEILSREAIKLGLDQNDIIIRRRLRQKMEFLVEDFSAMTEATDAELQAHLTEHPDTFREEPRFTFEHVYLSNDRGEHVEADAATILTRLEAKPATDPSELGDVFLGSLSFNEEPLQGVASQFGSAFPEQLSALPIGEWAGPIRSGYGAHLVLVTARTEGRLLTLEETRERVKRELLADRRRQANRALLDALLAKYQVKIDWPVPPAAGDGDARIKAVSLVQ